MATQNGSRPKSSDSESDNDEVDTVDHGNALGHGRFSPRRRTARRQRDLRDYNANSADSLGALRTDSALDRFTETFLEACERGDIQSLRQVLVPQHRVQFSCVDILNMHYDDTTATALHLAILNKQDTVARFLMTEYGKPLVVEPYKDGDYEGITALHLAIVNGMEECVIEMINQLSPSPEMEFNDFIHKESTGSFLTEGWHTSSVPLTLSLLSNHYGIFKLLASKSNALHRSTSAEGNTIIHSLVVLSLRDPKHAVNCLQFLVRNKDLIQIVQDGTGPPEGMESNTKLKALLTQKNNCGFTPLMYAIHLGASDFWNALMHVEYVYKFPQWNFHPYEWNVYDVTELMKSQQPYNISGLEMLAFNEEKQFDSFKTEPLKSLVADKWSRNILLYALSGLMHVVYMTLFTVAVLTKNIMKEEVSSAMEERPMIVLLTCVVLFLSVMFFLIQIVDFAKLIFSIPQNFIGSRVKGSKLSTKKLYRVSTIRTLYFITDTFIIIWAILRLVGSDKQAIVAVPPLIVGWYACLVYTFYHENICIFMFMLHYMLLTNVVYFLVALFFILVGCSTAFISLQFMAKEAKPDGMESIFGTLATLFRQTVAVTDIDELMDDYKYPVVARLLMICFLIVGTVLLLNTLIAAMNDTYNCVRDHKTEMWLRIKLQMALHIERRTFGLLNRMPQCCSYCEVSCKCTCRNEEVCKVSCKCNRVKMDIDNRKTSINITYKAISQKEVRTRINTSALPMIEFITDEGDGGPPIQPKRKTRLVYNDRWKNFFFRIKRENGRRIQSVFIKIKEFIKDNQ